MKGFLISFEGMEGAGKTTQCDLLEDLFKKKGYEVIVLREPGGVDISEQIRSVVLDPKNKKMLTTTEVLLFQAARAQLYGELVLPSLEDGKIVLMDRTRDSSTIYQGVVRGVGIDVIEGFNDYSTVNTTPNATILLDLPAQEGMNRRMKSGNLDRIEQEGVELQVEVCKAYLDFAAKDTKDRWVILDASQSVEAVHKQIIQALKKKKIIG